MRIKILVFKSSTNQPIKAKDSFSQYKIRLC